MESLVKLERILAKTAALDAIKTISQLVPKERQRVLLLDCTCLIETSHVYGRIAEMLFKLSRQEALKVNSISTFLDKFQRFKACPTGLTVVFGKCEILLKEDPMVLWSLIHISQILPDYEIPLRFLLISAFPFTEFSKIFDNIFPIVIIPFDTFQAFNNEEELIGNDKIVTLVDFQVEKVSQSTCPNGTSLEDYRGIVRNVYLVAKDQINDVTSLASYVSKIFPKFCEISNKRGIALSEAGKLYQAAIKPITSLVNGESLRSLFVQQVRGFSETEKYLLISSHIASNNPTSFDLKLFGNLGKKAKVFKKHSLTTTKIIKRASKSLHSRPKIFPLDRLLAIFYFIVSNPVPTLYEVETTLAGLVERRIIIRTTALTKLDNPKFRFQGSIDLINMIAFELKFDLGKYLIDTI